MCFFCMIADNAKRLTGGKLIVNIVCYIIVVVMVLYNISVYASENDSFTRRHEALPDLTDHLNQEVNGYLEEAVQIVNQQCQNKFSFNGIPVMTSQEADCCNPEPATRQDR